MSHNWLHSKLFFNWISKMLIGPHLRDPPASQSESFQLLWSQGVQLRDYWPLVAAWLYIKPSTRDNQPMSQSIAIPARVRYLLIWLRTVIKYLILVPIIADVGTDGLVCRGFSYPDTNFDRFHQFCLFSCASDFVYQYFQRDNLGVGPTPRTTEAPFTRWIWFH